MNNRPPTSFSPKELVVWMLSHAMLLSAVGPVVQFASGDTSQGEVLFAIPITLGIWETILLRRHIRRIWLWLPLTLVGLVLAFVLGLGWFFVPALGFGFGLAQLPLVVSSGFRYPGLWFVGSGVGWVAGFFAYVALSSALSRLAAGGGQFWAFYAFAGIPYGIATGLYLYLCSPKPASHASVPIDEPVA
jgi:hypothetical protein